MAAVDKAALLASRGLGTEMVEVPGVGKVEVRGLTRAEAMSVQKLGALDAADMEIKLISIAMVNPELTEDEVRQWYQVAPAGELGPVSDAIQRLSGMGTTEIKEQMTHFRD